MTRGWVGITLAAASFAAAAHAASSFVPSSQYDTRPVQGWSVRVNRELLAEDSRAGAAALKLLDRKLADIKSEVPAPAVARLQKVVIWLGVQDGHAPCAEYHPSRDWLVENGYNPDKARCVEIGSAERFVDWSRSQPAMILHELAHAYHHQVLGYDYAPIKKAYQAAVESKKYEAVARNNGRTERAYALTDEKEYFAEVSEAFFSRNDFYPFDRADLEKFDPGAAAMLRQAWGAP